MNGTVSKTDGISHAPAPRGSVTPITKMVTNSLDRMALDNSLTGAPEEFVRLHQLFEVTMNTLWQEPENGRLWVLSRAIATLRIKIPLLEALSDRRLEARDFEAVTVIRKQLESATRRMAMLLAEHRLATHTERRSVSVAVVGDATQVNVQAVR